MVETWLLFLIFINPGNGMAKVEQVYSFIEQGACQKVGKEMVAEVNKLQKAHSNVKTARVYPYCQRMDLY